MKIQTTLKKFIFTLGFILSLSAVEAQYVAIPDTNFANYLYSNGFSTCIRGNATIGFTMDTNCAASGGSQMDCESLNIHDMTGLQYCKNIISLACSHNFLTSLPDQMPPRITEIDCSYNLLDSLPADMPPNLFLLRCNNNRLTTLPYISSTSLQSVYCNNNLMTDLQNVAYLSGITYLDCSTNLLTSLPDLSYSYLGYLNCSYNPMDSLPALPANIYSIICSNDGLTRLPALRLPVGISTLVCDSNNLTSLPTLPTNITTLQCSNNPNLSCLPRIYENTLATFQIAGTAISCLPNRFSATSFDIDPNTLPLCTFSSGCPFYYNIAGNVHNDISADCISDSLNPGSLMQNIKVLLKQNGQVVQQCYMPYSGLYSFTTPTLQGYTVEVDTTYLPFVVACPGSDSIYVPLSATDTLVTGVNFGMQCPGLDYAAGVLWSSYFVPGDTTLVYVLAGNPYLYFFNAQCGAGLSGTVTTVLNGPVTYLSPAPGALVPSSVSGDTLTYTITNLDSLIPGSLYILVATDTSAMIGAGVCISAQIMAATPDIDPADDTMTQCFTVSSSFDPNHKTVSPTTLTTGSEWLTYTIDFQNTGTDTAHNVVVRDTLSSNVDASSFQYLASSSKATVQLFGSACLFTFPQVNLPDKNTNPIASQGWIQYKVKTMPDLPQTSQVLNTASIYFDFNPAIITNTTVTAYPSGIDAISGSNAIHIYPNPNGGSFTLETAYTSDVHYSIYDMLGDLVSQHGISSARQQIMLPDAAAGVYTLVVRSAGSLQTLKFVVAK
jgi:uncharacterized repeat protein (TIGR01451 family)